MSHQEALQHDFIKLYRLHEAIRLHLPASHDVLQRQVQQLHQVQAELDQLYQDLVDQSRRRRSLPFRSPYRRLLPFIQQMARIAENYKILAEEFPLDPHGSMGCLERIQQRSQVLLRRLKALELELFRPNSKSA